MSFRSHEGAGTAVLDVRRRNSINFRHLSHFTPSWSKKEDVLTMT